MNSKKANCVDIRGEDKVLRALYPEYSVGGFAPASYLVEFYSRVNSLITSESVVLDFGAGRGKFLETEEGWKLKLVSLRGRCAAVIGADVDSAVKSNPLVDKSLIIGSDGVIPLEDESIDVVVSWAVFEHLQKPEQVAREITRVLKPGGWICAWTPNKWGLVGIAARLVPNHLHVRILKTLGVDGRRDEDIFPVAYRLNTKSAIAQFFPKSKFAHFVSIRNGPPSYHGGSLLLARLMNAFTAVMPNSAGTVLNIFLRKNLS